MTRWQRLRVVIRSRLHLAWCSECRAGNRAFNDDVARFGQDAALSLWLHRLHAGTLTPPSCGDWAGRAVAQ